MGRIYRDASRVVVWLGESNSASSAAIKMLLAAGLGPESLIAYRSLFGDSSINAPNAFHAIFFREYWNRLWIVQEVTLAREVIVQCGTKTIPWDYLDSLVTYMDSISPQDNQSTPPTKAHSSSEPRDVTWIRANVESLPAHLVRLRRSTKKLTGNDFDDLGLCLLNLCCVRGQAYCVDPRDKIFGLHTLARKRCADTVPVDYSLSLFQLLTKVISHHGFWHMKPEKIVSESYKVLSASISLEKIYDVPLFLVHCIDSSRVSYVYSLSQEEITRDQQPELSFEVWQRLYMVGRLLQLETPSTNFLRITRQLDLVWPIGMDVSYYTHPYKADGLSGAATPTTLLTLLGNPPESTTCVPKSVTQYNNEDHFKIFKGS